MKKVKKLVSLLMALSMVFSLLAVSASAATPPDDPGISPLGIIESRPYNLNPYDISQSIPFVVGKNFTFWKIHIRTTNPNLQFNISKDSPSGQVVYWSSSAGYGTCVPTGGQAYYGQLAEGGTRPRALRPKPCNEDARAEFERRIAAVKGVPR